VSVARVDGTELGRGGGSSKKASEQEAARVALAALAAGAA
jgi:dsRNA-specific ribonuclease